MSLERAIVESFKLATKIGERIAIKAAKTAIQQKRTNLKKIGTTAREIGDLIHISPSISRPI